MAYAEICNPREPGGILVGHYVDVEKRVEEAVGVSKVGSKRVRMFVWRTALLVLNALRIRRNKYQY